MTQPARHRSEAGKIHLSVRANWGAVHEPADGAQGRGARFIQKQWLSGKWDIVYSYHLLLYSATVSHQASVDIRSPNWESNKYAFRR